MDGGAGNDMLLGGPGHDLLAGGLGDDWLDGVTGDGPGPSPDGEDWRFEQISSGGGNDRVFASDRAFDQVSCQSATVFIDADPGDSIICGDRRTRAETTLPGAPPAAPAPPLPPVWLPPTASLGDGKVRAIVRCPAAMAEDCTGTLEVRRTGTSSAAARRLGRARYDVEAGKQRTVRVRLPAKARRSVARRTPRRVVLQARPSADAAAEPSTRRVTLRARR